MKWFFLILISTFLLAASCDEEEELDTSYIDVCILEKADELEAKGDSAYVIYIGQYIYNNQIVYLFTSECCDMFNYVLDRNCDPVCAPSGGISGHGDGTCPDFYDNALLIRTVWEK